MVENNPQTIAVDNFYVHVIFNARQFITLLSAKFKFPARNFSMKYRQISFMRPIQNGPGKYFFLVSKIQ